VILPVKLNNTFNTKQPLNRLINDSAITEN